MAQGRNKYKVLCWGACEYQGHPCGIEYFGKRYETGAIVDNIPPAEVRHLLGKYIERIDEDKQEQEAVQE